MRVLHVCSEIYPLLKTGGLADVAGALPLAQLRSGVEARVLVPGFPALRAGVLAQELVAEVDGGIRLFRGTLPGGELPVYVIDAPHWYDRPGNPYADANNEAYPDNDRRFALLGWIAAQLARGPRAGVRQGGGTGNWHAHRRHGPDRAQPGLPRQFPGARIR